MIQVAGIERNSIVDGPGIRTVLYFSGCKWNCPNCHAKDLQSFTYGRSVEVSDLINEITEDIDFVDGITLSGGDPVFQARAVSLFLKEFRQRWPDKDVMLYTGFRLREVPEDLKLLVDYVMDGVYKKDLPTQKKWRGSDNQKLYSKIDGEWINED